MIKKVNIKKKYRPGSYKETKPAVGVLVCLWMLFIKVSVCRMKNVGKPNVVKGMSNNNP